MRKAVIAALAAAVVVAAALALPASGARAPAPERQTLLAALSGAEEPRGGDPDGVGASFVMARRGRTLCFRIVARNIPDAIAAHIHRGARGVEGPIAVGLFDGPRGNGDSLRSAGCVRASSTRLAREILRRPARFYVNVHTTAFPGGAIRGQLSR